MEAIAAHALSSLTSAAEAVGFPRQILARRSGIPVGRLTDAHGRATWTELTRLFEALGESGATAAEFRQMGRHTLHQAPFRRVVRLSQAILSPRALHLSYIQFALPRDFPLLGIEHRVEGERRLRLRVRVPDAARFHPGFFHYMHGCSITATEVMGLPPAQVNLEMRDREAEYVIDVPPDRSLVNRVRLVTRLLLRAEGVIDEFSEQQRQINEYYSALLRTRDNFQHVIERLPDAVLIHRQGAIVYANTAAAKVLGLPEASSLLGRRPLDLIHPDDQPRAAQLLSTTSAGQPGLEPLRGVRADEREVLLEVAPTQDIAFDDGEASLTLLRDVTERRRLEEQLMAADRLSSLGAVSAGMAHELNNPLAYVALNLQALERVLESIPDQTARARAKEAAAAARHGVERATTIVRDLSSFARPEKDSIEIVELSEVVKGALGMLANEVASRARLVHRAPHRAPVLGNRSRLEQVFLNLLLNALQSFEGDNPAQNEITIVVHVEGDQAIAEIRDNGRGIPARIRPRIFDPLFTTKPVGEGTGLGLSICHGIVTAAGGSIEVNSHEGAGSTFRVVLPRAALAPRCESPPPPSPPKPRPRRRLLVIDDEPALLHALEAVLAEFHDVRVEADAAAALELLRRDRGFDLILCDLIMSGMSGMDLHRELEAFDPTLVPRVVFMTGGASTPRARSFLDTTKNHVLEKPFHFDMLLAYVEEYSSEHERPAPAPSERP
jgi:PAS domain S-box-containing protein